METYKIIYCLLVLSQAFILKAVQSQPVTPIKYLTNESDAISFQIFSNLILEKYTPSPKSNILDITHLWNNLVLQPNSSSHVSRQEASLSDQDICNKLSNNSELCSFSTKCLSATELANALNKEFIDSQDLTVLCPLMLYQLESRKCHDLSESNKVADSRSAETSKKPSSTEVWGYGVLFVTLISLCSLVGVSVLPLMGKAFYSKVLTVMIGLAVGSLTGSSVFHLIPQAFGLMDSDPDHRYLRMSFLVIGGIWLFFMIERFLKMIMDKGKRNSQLESVANNTVALPAVAQSPTGGPCIPDVGTIYESQEQVIKASFGHQTKPTKSRSHEHMIHFKSGDSPIATVAWMIIFGDGFHNFIDGLSLGAAFNESISTGISISVAVMCEELPHELGDFAVLLSAGMTMRQALIYNFLSACTCYLGLACGIVLGEFEASKYIFALAGGMFLYIALVDMMPEMNEIAEEASRESVAQALKTLLLQNVGIIFGVLALFFLAKYGDLIRIA